jgi:hypothetical protein
MHKKILKQIRKRLDRAKKHNPRKYKEGERRLAKVNRYLKR